ncbi:MAG TPA: carboxypeptidase regulatory-like domain-containing protein [Kofleriaceae bacterium]|nr:carboxypeptidase regulatory-like domain-containing protein [Kofleriaceae bacterium]
MKPRPARAAIAAAILAAIAVLAWLHFHRATAPGATAHDPQPHGADGRGFDRNSTNPGGSPSAEPVLDDDDPTGALRLEGLVLGADDHPVAGAVVAISSTPGRTATTDAGGSFAFDNLVGRAYRVVARATEGVAGPVVVHLTEKSDPVVLHLRAGAKLAVTVAGPDGKPIGDASVELRGEDKQTAKTAATGIATITPIVPGNYQLVASAPGMAPAHQQVRVNGETRVRIVLLPGAPVSGRVVDESNKPVAGARVVYTASGQFFGQADWRLDAITTGADGTWKFAALPRGSFRFLASDSDHATGTSALIAHDGSTEKTGVEIALPAGATVHGRVVDSGKAPVPGAHVQVMLAFRPAGGRGFRAGGTRPPPRQTYSDDKGEFVVRGLPRDQLVATAQHEKGAASAVEIDATSGDAKDVTLVLDLTGAIAGTVVDQTGQPVEGAQVNAAPAFNGGGFGGFGGGPPAGSGSGGFDPSVFLRAQQNVALTDAGGRFRITGLADGAYTVRASRSGIPRGGRRGRRGGSDGVEAKVGDEKVQIVLPAEGNVRGKVAFADGKVPTAFTASVAGTQQAFFGGDFELDGLAPGDYRLDISGPSFDSHSQDVQIEPAQTTDVGSITVASGRRIAGVVVSNNAPVPGATVYAGNQVVGGPSSNDSPINGFAGLGANTKQDTTDQGGAFLLAGFPDGDLTVIADLPGTGRSKALLVAEDDPNSSALVLQLQPYGSISGVLTQGGSPAAGIVVTVQSTTTPGALYVAAAGGDGAYRFDQLAPDTYKVSATLGNPRRGLHQYSQQVTVPSGGDVVVNISVDQGNVTLDLAGQVTSGGPPGAIVGYLSSSTIAATSYSQLQLAIASAGAGTTQVATQRGTTPASFTDVSPGAYTGCMVPLPPDLRGATVISYMQQHAKSLAAFCQAVTVATTPATQTVTIPVTVPPPSSGGSAAP